MSHKTDLRIQKTNEHIRDAFIELLMDIGFDKITVRALCEQAKINRATFYRHYADKFDLAEKLTDLMFAEVNAQIADTIQTNPERSWVILFEHVGIYAPFYRAMLGPKGTPNFTAQVIAAVEAQMIALSNLLETDLQLQPRLPPAIARRYMATAQVGFVQWWLENDMPFPEEEAAAYLIQLHQNGGIWALGYPQPPHPR